METLNLQIDEDRVLFETDSILGNVNMLERMHELEY